MGKTELTERRIREKTLPCTVLLPGWPQGPERELGPTEGSPVPSSALPDRKQRAGAEMEQLGLEPAPMCDAAAQGGGSAHYTTALAGGHGPRHGDGQLPASEQRVLIVCACVHLA